MLVLAPIIAAALGGCAHLTGSQCKATMADTPVSADVFWSTENARQAVAVDDRFLYAIDNRRISKLDKLTGRSVRHWNASDYTSDIEHLNSGVVHKGRLYAAHSNWPNEPARNTIEVWRVDDLTHIESISLPYTDAWITWLDYYADHWWATLARYGPVALQTDLQRRQPQPVSEAQTRLILLSDDHLLQRSWSFPEPLLAEFAPMSNSGGSWSPDGKLWLTGHDQPCAYTVSVSAQQDTLVWRGTEPLPTIEGQGIAWDRSATPDRILYGVQRSSHQIVQMVISLPSNR